MLVEMPDGRRLHIHAGDRPYGRVLLVGEYEPDTSAALRQFATTGAFAIDVGANQGWLSVLIGRAVGADGQVWAFEPTPPIVPALHDNLRRNPDVRARVFETALGDEQGELTINVFAGLPSAHASASTLGRSDATSYTVPVTTLDALRSEMPALPSLIKIDVEGAELAVLRGAQGVLEQAAEAVIVLEVNHETSAAFGYRPADILAELERHRPYRIFRAGQFGLEPEPDPDQAPHGATWVCVPPGVAAEPRGVS
jgi:FkbM family methyltransferase